MRSRYFFILCTTLLISEVASAQFLSTTLQPRADEKPSELPECTFEGNSDFYGVGVRVGFYLTWLSGLIAFVCNPEGSEKQADAQTVFLLANLIALVILQANSAADTNVVVPILLFYMFFGGSVVGVTSATASLGAFRHSRGLNKISILGRQILVQLTFLGMLTYSFYFWTKGFESFKTFPEVCGGTFVFPVRKRLSLNKPSGGSVLALLFLVLIYLLIWLVSYKRLRRSFGNKPRSNFALTHGDATTQFPPWHQGQRKWTIIGGTLITFTIIWSIAGIELTLVWNRVTGVNELGNTGQLIPFVMGIASLIAASWGVLVYWQEVKWERKNERLSNPNDMEETAFPEKHLMSPASPYFGQNGQKAPLNGTQADASHPLIHQGSTEYISST